MFSFVTKCPRCDCVFVPTTAAYQRCPGCDEELTPIMHISNVRNPAISNRATIKDGDGRD